MTPNADTGRVMQPPTAEYVEWLIDLLREARQYLPEATGLAEDIDDLFATLAHNDSSVAS